MGPQQRQPGSGNACVWAVATVLLLAVLAGGGCLVLYLALPPAEAPHWLPIAGLALVAFPWAFWIATCAYRCCRSSWSSSSPGEANQRVERQPSSRPAAVAPLPTNLKSAVRSPTACSGGMRRVHFGEATVLGEKGGGGDAAVEQQDDCSSVTSPTRARRPSRTRS
ncbi:hypothetical protein GUJ93_ZPchr0012g19589 [Zizania palustris]|uniref:Uncharacterized protein n=1 Tax=Zizania palustris TaxID=103762 RepID=A0A8J5WUE1_ZIZPA|nr:hypothetical protein GUJ93_ZPchr0012g19589 [Zizania palustris]